MDDQFTDTEILQALGRELKEVNQSLNVIKAVVVAAVLLWLLGAVLLATGAVELTTTVDGF